MRLIDTDALLKDGIRVEFGYNADGLLMIPMRDVTKSIKNAPTVDAVEVVHGRWIAYGGNQYTRISQCTNCCAKYDFMSNYCPNCGAKMDGEGNEDRT